MKHPLGLYPGQLRLPCLVLLALLLLPGLRPAQAGEAPPAPAGQFALVKHRVEVVVPPPADRPAHTDLSVTVSKELIDPTSPGETGSVRAQEWATAVDLLKSRLADSTVLRLVEPLPPQSEERTAKKNRTPWVLQARFATMEPRSRALLRLIHRADGTLLAKGEAEGVTLPQAITTALDQVEKEMLRRAWRCRVQEVANDKLIIPYGRLDGLRRGQLLLGYSMAPEARQEQAEINELLLMKSGRQTGRYQATDVGEEFTALQPVDNSPLLASGDVLEAPAVGLHEMPRSPSSTIWDKIYEKKP